MQVRQVEQRAGGDLRHTFNIHSDRTATGQTTQINRIRRVAAELVSFSAVIDRVPPLRWLDRLGRVNAPPAPAPH